MLHLVWLTFCFWLVGWFACWVDWMDSWLDGWLAVLMSGGWVWQASQPTNKQSNKRLTHQPTNQSIEQTSCNWGGGLGLEWQAGGSLVDWLSGWTDGRVDGWLVGGLVSVCWLLGWLLVGWSWCVANFVSGKAGGLCIACFMGPSLPCHLCSEKAWGDFALLQWSFAWQTTSLRKHSGLCITCQGDVASLSPNNQMTNQPMH